MVKYKVGDHIFLEMEYANFFGANRDPKLLELKVVRANTSSAYAVILEDLAQEKPSEYRFNQQSGRYNDRPELAVSYSVWPSREAFEEGIRRRKRRKVLKAKAEDLIKYASIEQLEEILTSMGVDIDED